MPARGRVHDGVLVMPKPRLLILGPLPPPIGGVETVTQAILESDAFQDFDVAHADTTKGRPKQTQGRFDLGNFVWAARHAARVLGAVRRHRPDIVYMPVAGTWSGFLRDMALAAIVKRAGARLVGHVHGSDFHFILERRGVSAGVARRGLAQFDRLLVLGERGKAQLEAYRVRAPVEVAPSTFRREVFERAAAWTRAHKSNGRVVGLFVGQVGRRKGVFDLLPALRRVKDAGVDFRMVFVGPAELEGEWEQAQQMRDWLGVADVAELTGALMGEELYARFREGDVFVMPSHTEGLPVVFFEAGAFEMPVVTTPVGAIPDLVVNERNGLLVEPGKTDQIVAAITRMARDHEGRRRMARQLKQDIQAFHPDRVCARIAQAVRDTLAQP